MIDVTAAVIVKDNQIFAARRAPGKDQAGFWEFPGGKVERGESFTGCLIRELKEELNIDAKVIKYLLETTHTYVEKTVRLFAYEVQWISGDITLVDHDEYRWLNLETLDSMNWAPADLPIVELIKTRYKNIE